MHNRAFHIVQLGFWLFILLIIGFFAILFLGEHRIHWEFGFGNIQMQDDVVVVEAMTDFEYNFVRYTFYQKEDTLYIKAYWRWAGTKYDDHANLVIRTDTKDIKRIVLLGKNDEERPLWEIDSGSVHTW